MATATASFSFPYLAQNQANAQIPYNALLNWVDTFANGPVIKDITLTAPPGTPIDGDLYVPAATATGAWAGKEGMLALSYGAAWTFFPLRKGFHAWIDSNASGAKLRVWSGTAWQAPLNLWIAALTDGATINTDASTGRIFRVTLGGNRTMAAPTNPSDGQDIRYQIKQDGTGSRTVTWGTAFLFTTTFASPTLSTAAGATDYISFQYRASDSKWVCTGFNKGS